MPIDLRWTTDAADLERIARVRLHTYMSAETSADAMRGFAEADRASGEAEFLLATDGREDVGTSTAWSFDMHCRGAVLPCQGVAWVGTIKTARRRGDGSEGVATRVMRETLRRARERGFVLSALMPFRASFYQHFGYGLAERRVDWTIPISILPRGSSDGFAFAQPSDHDAIHACRQRQTSAGQCDITRSAARWRVFHSTSEVKGFTVVDRPDPAGPVRSWMWLEQFQRDGKDYIQVSDGSWDSPASLKRMLGFLSTLRDQYAFAVVKLPADVPLNRLLSEVQVPHRLVNHPVADPRVYTRMQVRVLDHARYMSSLNWPGVKGTATVSVHECEGTVSTFRLDVADGHATCTPASGSADVNCTDHVFASVVTGDVSASDARTWGMLEGTDQGVALLDALSVGSRPFSNEYF